MVHCQIWNRDHGFQALKYPFHQPNTDYINISPTQASCISLDTNEEVDVTQVSRGICQDISVIPEKKGKYKIELEFDYDPGVLSNISNIKISGSNKVKLFYL